MADETAQPGQEQVKSDQKLEVLSPEFINRFVGETYRFVTQLHLELTTLTTVALKKGLVTVEELDETFKQVKQNFDANVARQREAEANGRRKQARPEDSAEGAMDIGHKPVIPPTATPVPAEPAHGG